MSEPNKSSFISPWWGLYAILILGFPLFFLFKPTTPLNDFGQVSQFKLQDQLSREFSSERLQDKPSIVNFIFTRCPNICPTLTARMALVQKKTDKENVQLISISVDPVHDTAAVLKEYGERFQADPERWVFLTGTEEDIKSVSMGFKQAYQIHGTDDNVPDILHSQKFVLVDRSGIIRGFYDDDNEGIEEMLLSLDRL